MPIGDWLRDERKRLGLSQPAFAALAGTTKQTLFSWETGKTAPDAFQLAAFAAAGADVLYILTGQPIADTASAAAQGIDTVRLAIAIEAVEEGLEETRRRLSPKKKAELVMAAYELINQTSQSRDNVIRLVRMAA